MVTRTFTFNGKRIYVRGKTEREAADRLAEKKLALMTKKTAVASDLTTDEWFDVYLKTYKVGIAPGTLRDYKSLYTNIIKPYIGPLKLSTVTPLTCQTIINSISDKSSSYIKKTANMLKSMFVVAQDNELIVKNPAARLIIPKGTEGKRRALTIKEREIFLKACENERPSGLFCKVMYYTGLRPSEVARIRGGDYKDGRLHVRGTKTEAANRFVPLPSALKLPKLKKGELMFKTKTGNPIDKKRIEIYWNEIKGEMNKEIETPGLTMYCLRHDYCTRLEEAGVAIDVAKRLMGHSSIEVTSRIYTHGSENSFNSAMQLIEKFNQKSATPVQHHPQKQG